mgnify:FL=1
MAARQHPRSHSNPGGDGSPWLSLTDLGRLYGISAMHCGRLLNDAGLRDRYGNPTAEAVNRGCANGGEQSWHRQHCRGAFEAAGLVTVRPATLVQQWVDLLIALSDGSPSINTSAEQMAEEMPAELMEPVNLQLRQQGCSFQVQRPQATINRGGGARSGARRARTEPAPGRPGRSHGQGGRPQAHGASG